MKEYEKKLTQEYEKEYDEDKKFLLSKKNEKAKVSYSSKILTFFCMYIIYEDKKSINDHIKLHKLSHYDIKLEEKKKELLDNIPQVLTNSVQNDLVSLSFYKNNLFFNDDSVYELQNFYKAIVDYIQENYPEHFVKKILLNFYINT